MHRQLQHLLLLLALLGSALVRALSSPTLSDPIQILQQSKNARSNLTTPSDPNTAKLFIENQLSGDALLQRNLDSVAKDELYDSYGHNNSQYPGTLLKRVVPFPITWQGRVDKGNWLVCLMKASNEAEARILNQGDPVAGTLLDFDLIERWGYWGKRQEDNFGTLYGNKLDQAFHALGINKDNNQKWDFVQVTDVENDEGEMVWWTGGKFFNLFNPTDKTIIAEDNVAPKWANANPDRGPDSPLPELQHWSDFAYILWAEVSPNPSQLKYIIRAGVEEPDSRRWAAFALFNGNVPLLPPFSQRVTFNMDTDEGKAILASHNGAGAAFFLAQHKAQLGVKTIASVTLWTEDKNGWDTAGYNDDYQLTQMGLSYYFTIVNV